MKQTLIYDDFVRAGHLIDLDPALIQAVCKVEAPFGGFDENDLPRILFEGHHFSRLTNHVYDQSHPTISYMEWTRRFYSRNNTGELNRLAEAAALDRNAALQSASWGRFQIMGFNHVAAGFPVLQDFINAMYDSETAQLTAFVYFLKNDKGGRMITNLRNHKWAAFARDYNGPGYADNQYDTKLATAYADFS